MSRELSIQKEANVQMAMAIDAQGEKLKQVKQERDASFKRVNALMELLADAQKERDSSIERVDKLDYLLRVKEGVLGLAEMQRDDALAQARNLKRDLETCLTVQERLNEHNTALRQLVRDYRTWLRDAHTDTRTIESDNWMAIYDDLEATARRLLREESPK